jgi:hypothetical protein
MRIVENQSIERSRPLDLAAIVVTGVGAGGCLGALTSAVNGWVSPFYYMNILGWHDVEDVWRASIAQGLFEGLLFGVFFASIFATITGLITKAACPYAFAFRHVMGILAGASICWVLGGLSGVGLAALSPEFYRRAFIGVPSGFSPMLGYAWVGGSIWGLELGGLVAVILGLVVLRSNWRRRIDELRELGRGHLP